MVTLDRKSAVAPASPPAAAGEIAQQHLQLQYAVSQALSEAASEADACARILSIVCRTCDWRWGAVWIREGEELRLLDCFTAVAHEFQEISRACRFTEGMGLPGRVWKEKCATWFDDISTVATMPRRNAAARSGLHAALALPICGREFLGVVEFLHEKILPPDNDLIQNLSAITAQLAQFIERKRTEQALADSQSLFQAIFEGAQDAILLANDDGRYIEANPAATKLLGYRRDELLAKHVWELTPSVNEEKARQLWLDFLMTQRMEGEFPLRCKDGSSVDVDFRASARIIPGVHLSVIRNIMPRKQREQRMRELVDAARQELLLREKVETELKNLNHELEQRIEERTAALQESHSELEAFCYSVSHDLRAPLRSMQGFSHALLEDHGESLNEEGRDFARRILSAAEHMDGLLADVLAYSRLSRQQLKMEPVRVEDVVADAKIQLHSEVTARGACVEAQDCSCHVLANRSVFELMLVNLIENGMKFAQPGRAPRVTISATRNGKRQRIWVRDNGIGIAREHYQRIFRIFERLHGVETYPGTGIGLALVQKAAERMNGAAGVESIVGEGSSFWIELPAAD